MNISNLSPVQLAELRYQLATPEQQKEAAEAARAARDARVAELGVTLSDIERDEKAKLPRLNLRVDATAANLQAARQAVAKAEREDAEAQRDRDAFVQAIKQRRSPVLGELGRLNFPLLAAAKQIVQDYESDAHRKATGRLMMDRVTVARVTVAGRAEQALRQLEQSPLTQAELTAAAERVIAQFRKEADAIEQQLADEMEARRRAEAEAHRPGIFKLLDRQRKAEAQ